MRLSRLILSALALAGALPGAAARAQDAGGVVGAPHAWEMGMRPAFSPVADHVQALHNELLVIITLVTLLVVGLLAYVIFRFNERRNPTPSRTSHNALIEVLWTALPVIILVIIAVPSFKLLYYSDRTHDAEMTIKAIGHQWYWSYEYPDNGNFTFDTNLVDDKDLKPGQLRLLTTDNPVVVPVDTNVRLLVTSTDVIHSWFMPNFAVKLDAVPGRVNETWFRAEKEGVYYGQCAQLCGIHHAFMPIMLEAVSKEKFKAWAAEAKTKFASVGQPLLDAPKLAQATAD